MLDEHGRYKKCRHSSHRAGQAHELTFSCFQRLPLLSRERTCEWLLESLDRARLIHHFELWAYVIMPEHVHILLMPQTPEWNSAEVLKSIKQPVSRRAVNYLRENSSPFLTKLRSHDGREEFHFWQPGGGYDRSLSSPEVGSASVEYIHLNPVRRGLVDSPLDWPWSSAGWYAGQDECRLRMDACPWV